MTQKIAFLLGLILLVILAGCTANLPYKCEGTDAPPLPQQPQNAPPLSQIQSDSNTAQAATECIGAVGKGCSGAGAEFAWGSNTYIFKLGCDKKKIQCGTAGFQQAA